MPVVHRSIFLVAVLLTSPWLAGCPDKDSAALKKAQKAQKQRALSSLPYVVTRPINKQERKTKMGVVRNLPGAAKGLTVFCSEQTDDVKFIDMKGEVRHTITLKGANCRLMEPYGNEDFLIMGNGVLARVAWDSTVRWRHTEPYNPDDKGHIMSFHHDMDVAENGDVLVLANRNRYVKHLGRKLPLRDDEIVVLSPKGKVKKRHSMYDIVRGLVPTDRYQTLFSEAANKAAIWDQHTDILHTNTLEVLRADIPNVAKKGQVLTAVRYLDLVAILDLDAKKVVWWWGPGTLEWPHNPTLLPSGTLLMFDNGSRRKFSRILEISPQDKKVVWKYVKAKGKERFFSDSRGSAQLLPNNNLLITESDHGRLFEITREGKIVWEYFNTDLVEKDKKGKKITERRLIYRAARYFPDTTQNPLVRNLIYRAYPHMKGTPKKTEPGKK